MPRQPIMRPVDPGPVEARRRFRIGLLATASGSLIGILTSLYSAEFRHLLEAPWQGLADYAVPFGVTAAVASISTVIIHEYATRRRQPSAVTAGEIVIGTDVLRQIVGEDEPVVGRSLRYLELKRPTDDLVVLLHGLGLDANDFRPYLVESTRHGLALTLYGFNTVERDHPHYQPISLESHAQLVSYALRRIQRSYPRKRLTVVGFSFGADLLLYLAEHHRQLLAELRIRRTVLLDPNVNSATTTISSKVAEVGSDSSLPELVSILRTAGSAAEFRYLCEYLSKITSKNFAQVQRHAKEMGARYRQRSFGPFLDWLGKLAGVTGDLRLVLSLNQEIVFNALVRAAANRGFDITRLECSRGDHFELIDPGYLNGLLERHR